MRSMQIPHPKTHNPKSKHKRTYVGIWRLGFGIWVLGFGIFAPALAQSPYVAGAIGADVSRSSHGDSSFYPSPSNGAEVLSGALRVGTSINRLWGVELEYVRSGRSSDDTPTFNPLAQAGSASVNVNAVQLLPGVG